MSALGRQALMRIGLLAGEPARLAAETGPAALDAMPRPEMAVVPLDLDTALRSSHFPQLGLVY